MALGFQSDSFRREGYCFSEFPGKKCLYKVCKKKVSKAANSESHINHYKVFFLFLKKIKTICREYLRRFAGQVAPAATRILLLDSLSWLLRTSSCSPEKANRSHFRQQRMPSLSCRHPSLLVQSAPTPGLIHQLRSLPLGPQPGLSAPVSSSLPSAVKTSPRLSRGFEAASAAKRLRFQLWIFAHPSCQLSFESFGPKS